MGHEIAIATGPEIEFVMDMHEKAFIKETIDYYMDLLKGNLTDVEVPHVQEIPYSAVFMLASARYDWHGDLEFFKEETSRFQSEEDLYQHCVDELDALFEDEYDLSRMYAENIRDDMERVLDFHRMCYGELIYNPFNGKHTLYIHNGPAVQIW